MANATTNSGINAAVRPALNFRVSTFDIVTVSIAILDCHHFRCNTAVPRESMPISLPASCVPALVVSRTFFPFSSSSGDRDAVQVAHPLRCTNRVSSTPTAMVRFTVTPLLRGRAVPVRRAHVSVPAGQCITSSSTPAYPPMGTIVMDKSLRHRAFRRARPNLVTHLGAVH